MGSAAAGTPGCRLRPAGPRRGSCARGPMQAIDSRYESRRAASWKPSLPRWPATAAQCPHPCATPPRRWSGQPNPAGRRRRTGARCPSPPRSGSDGWDEQARSTCTADPHRRRRGLCGSHVSSRIPAPTGVAAGFETVAFRLHDGTGGLPGRRPRRGLVGCRRSRSPRSVLRLAESGSTFGTRPPNRSVAIRPARSGVTLPAAVVGAEPVTRKRGSRLLRSRRSAAIDGEVRGSGEGRGSGEAACAHAAHGAG